MYHILLDNHNVEFQHGQFDPPNPDALKCTHDDRQAVEHPYAETPGFSKSEVSAVADQIATKLAKLVEVQLQIQH